MILAYSDTKRLLDGAALLVIAVLALRVPQIEANHTRLCLFLMFRVVVFFFLGDSHPSAREPKTTTGL